MDRIKDDPKIIKPIFDELRESYLKGKARSLDFRKQQLKNLLKGLNDLKDKFDEAWNRDLGGGKFTSQVLSYSLTVNEVEECLENVYKWNDTSFIDTPVALGPGKCYLKPEPMGVILIIGAWNYPLNLSVPYAAAAIAGGNSVIIKTSEMSPSTSEVIAELFDKYMDKSCYRVIEGQVEVAKSIITFPFDKIVFTGSTQKGRLVAEAAAKNLVPVVLELGGKSPTVVDEKCDLTNAALRIAQGRFTNCGQTCIANDYVFVHKNIKEKFINLLKEKVVEFYGNDPSQSPDYSKIVNEFHCQRLKSYLDEKHEGKVIIGGEVKIKDRYVAPTIIDSPKLDSMLMKDEIFGPILPVFEFEDIDKVIEFINRRPKPLALYYYGPKGTNYEKLKNNTSSGSLCMNESIFQFANGYLPFGGVQESGMGVVHGYAGFKELVHLKPIFEKGTNNSYPYNLRYPPFTSHKKKMMGMLLSRGRLKEKTVHTAIGLIVVLVAGAVAVKNGYVASVAKSLLEYLAK